MKILKLMLIACVVLMVMGCGLWPGSDPDGEDQTAEESGDSNLPAVANLDEAAVERTDENIDDDDDEVEEEPTESPTPKPTEVEIPRATVQEDDDPEPVPVAADSEVVETLAGSVGERGARVYSAAGSATTVLRTLPAGTDVTMLSISSNGVWVEVDPSDFELAASVKEAWIPMRHLAELTDGERSSLFRYAPQLTADVSAWVRLEPSKTSTIMNSMEEGERATILGMNEDITWYEVEKENGRIGWISASIVTLVEPENLKGIARFNPNKRDDVTPTPTVTPIPTATPAP